MATFRKEPELCKMVFFNSNVPGFGWRCSFRQASASQNDRKIRSLFACKNNVAKRRREIANCLPLFGSQEAFVCLVFHGNATRVERPAVFFFKANTFDVSFPGK